jgi:amino acid adenylation domain-containing protein
LSLAKSEFHSQNITQALRLQGVVNLAVLRTGLERLATKYGFPTTIGAKISTDILPVHDFSRVPVSHRDLEVSRYLHQQAGRPLGRKGDPHLRGALARLSSTECVLLMVLDASTTAAKGVLVDRLALELSVLYNAAVASHSQVIPVLPAAQPGLLSELTTDGSFSSGKQKAENEIGALELPADRPRSSIPGGIFGREAGLVQNTLLPLLREVSIAEGVQPFATLLAAFTVLLSRHSEQKQFYVGVLRSNLEPAGESAASKTSALTPLRADLRQDPSFRELLLRTRRSSLAAFGDTVAVNHGDRGRPADYNVIPISGPLEKNAKPDESAHEHVLQVGFILEQPAWETAQFSGLTVSRYELEARSVGMDLVLHVEESPEGLALTADYDAALFDPDTIRRFLGHYEILLSDALSHPELNVSKLALLSEPEHELLLQMWNATAQEYPSEVPLPELIEAQVLRTPDAVAVVFQDQHLTYAELNGRANRLAAHLRSLGVTRNTLVGVCLERSIDLLVAPLAILKAGGAYLPLDPEHPGDRIGPIVEDAGLEILIGRSELGPRLPNFAGQLVLLDWDAYEKYAPTNHPVPGSGHDLAYVIYTSGSTGRPKGVMIPRRALNNLLWSVREWFEFGAHDVLLALTTIAFDIAGLDLWLPLLVGARILVVDRATTLDARLLQDTIQREGVTFLQCTPSSWKLLMESAWPGKPNLQAVCTGEAMPKDLARKLVPRVARLWNMYGPTETTIWSSGYRFSDPADPVLIGRPLPNTRLYVLDQHLEPTPIGVPGELYIAGDGLALGYWNNPTMTDQRFIPDPFSTEPGARLYKTGDLVRYRIDGEIECLGRNDDQIKLRGFRIEPEEIRSALTKHPSIRDAIGVLETGATGDSRIVAYLIADGTVLPEATELRAFLRRSLPDYMIPASFLFVESFPLNSNGKIDRRALPHPRMLSHETVRRGAPTDELESRLRNIFRSVLGLIDIGIDDDFFDLGGHSLTAAQLFREINLCFNLDLPLATLFHAPTVRRVAALIRDAGVEQMSAPVVQIQGQGSQKPMYCLGAVDGELIVFRRLALELGHDQPLYGLQPFRLLNESPTVNQLASAYIDELRKAGVTQPYCLLGYSFGGLVAVEMARQLQQDGIAPPLVMLIDASYPAGCRANEPWALRLRRYRFLWDQVARSGGVSHLIERVKYGSARLAHRATSTVGVPLPNGPSDVYTRQQLASESYRIKSYNGRVHLFRAESQQEFLAGGEDLGWSGVLSGLVIEHVPGDHGTINTGINLKILARKVQECLRRALVTGRAVAQA